jgi:hypothetical protein
MTTATVSPITLQLTSHYAEKKHELPFKRLPVYNCDIRECIRRLSDAVIQQGRMHISPALGYKSLLLEIGMDKSNQGFIESISLGIQAHSHGKYGSLITCMTSNKIKENYNNIREIALINNRKQIIDQLLEFSNLIIIVKTSRVDDTIVSKQIESFTMTFTPTTQKYWNETLQQQLVNIPSPQQELLTEDRPRMCIFLIYFLLYL